MMTAEELFASGQVDESFEAAKNDVRKDGAAVKPRIFLFQMLCINGEWDRALTQLNVIGDLDKDALPMVQTYREALRCEVLRAEVFEGKRSPMVFGEPETWIAGMMEALQRDGAGKHDQAQLIRTGALEASPVVGGSIDGAPFDWLCDADPRIGPLLEAIISGRYYWIPFARIRSIQIDAPEDLRDFVWMPAQFTFSNGGQTVGLIPTRYPASDQHADASVRLARQTVWQEISPDIQFGIGQRLLATNIDDYPLMDVREITLNSVDSADDESVGVTDG